MLSEDDFVDRVAAELGISRRELTAGTFEALGFDSLQMYELDLIVEELGALVSDEDIVSARSIHDLYEAYRRTIAKAD